MSTRMKFKKELRKLHRETCIPLGKERKKFPGLNVEKWASTPQERLARKSKKREKRLAKQW